MPIGPADEGGWAGTVTPGAGLAASATRPNQKGSQQERLPDGPPKTNPGPVARQPPPSLHGLQPLCCLPSPTRVHRRADEHEPHRPTPDADGTARPPQPGPRSQHGPADPGKRMLGRVLTGNGITAYGNGHYSLIGGDELSDTERDELQLLCRQRLDALREQRGEEVFAHRSRHRAPISGSVKCRVLTDAPGAAASAAGRTSTSGPWRWTTSSPKTRAAPTPSATCRRSVSAATPASTTAVCLRKRAHRLPRRAGQLRPPRSGLCVLRAGGQRLGWFAQRKRGIVSSRRVKCEG
jgi:hypothetical protein